MGQNSTASKEKNNTSTPIRWGEFRDQALEKEFYNAEITRNLNYVKFTMLVAGMVYFLFIIPEYFLITDVNDFRAIFINRSVVLVAMFCLYFKVKRDTRYDTLIYWFTALEILISISFIFISNQFPNPDILIQAFGVMIIILVIFLINNRWLFSVFTALFISIGYFVFVAISFTDINISEFLAAMIHIAIVIFLSSISSYSVNYYKRIQYLHNIELVKMAETDALTGIYNKAKFNQEYAQMADNAKARSRDLAVIMFDIDDFKAVNDNFGHLVGDQVLKELTALVRRNINKTDILARWGGEEFVIILPDSQLEEALKVAQRLRMIISEHPFHITGAITCSFGVGSFKHDDTVDTLLHRVDERLYRAKKSGKNRVE
ncbi:GGDEF domain-containing protein [Acetobacterium sp.]|uniref:GGDEF domain-containing protein n=1 Tax=Acetobacterium sp. TaxID=1872094 RepID=UPI0035930128